MYAIRKIVLLKKKVMNEICNPPKCLAHRNVKVILTSFKTTLNHTAVLYLYSNLLQLIYESVFSMYRVK